MTIDNKVMTPNEFFDSILEEPTESKPEEKEPEEDASNTDSVDDSASESENKDEDKSKENNNEDEETSDDDKVNKEEPEVELIEVKVDGEKEKVSKEDLVKSYERYKASTQRFQKASEEKKEAEKIKVEAENLQKRTRATFDRMLIDPDVLIDIYTQHAPDTFHRAVEKYIQRANQDAKLYENDKDLYHATVEARKQQNLLKQQQAEIAKQKAELEERNKQHAQDSETRQFENAKQLLQDEIPNALKLAGVNTNHDEIDMHYLDSALRRLMDSNWIEGKTKLTKDYIIENAKELIKYPTYKKYISKFVKKVEKEVKEESESGDDSTEKTPEKKKMTVVKPNSAKPKPKIMDSNSFWRGLIG
jgi:hypothetical protein